MYGLPRLNFNVISIVEVTKHIQERSSVEGKQEIDEFWVVAVRKHNSEVMVEYDAELYLKYK